MWLFSRFGWHVDTCVVKDSKSAYGTRVDLLRFLKDIFELTSKSSIFIASYDSQFS